MGTDKKELDDHIREWHAEYNCNQCENSYRLKGDLENHIKKAHSKEREINPEFRIEKQNYESKCDLCKTHFKNRNRLEEHLEEHREREEYIEPNEFQCVECKEFFSRDDAIKHENEGECDQCGKWLGCEKNVQTHKLKEHKIINKKENKDSHEPNIIRADKDKFINETRIKEKDVIEMFKIVSENPDREIETTKKQDKTKEKTTKDTPIDKNKTKQKFLER